MPRGEEKSLKNYIKYLPLARIFQAVLNISKFYNMGFELLLTIIWNRVSFKSSATVRVIWASELEEREGPSLPRVLRALTGHKQLRNGDCGPHVEADLSRSLSKQVSCDRRWEGKCCSTGQMSSLIPQCRSRGDSCGLEIEFAGKSWASMLPAPCWVPEQMGSAPLRWVTQGRGQVSY